MIKLSENDIIGKGGERTVYLHPIEKKYCIKIPNEQNSRSQIAMLREIKYLNRHQNYLKHLSKYQYTTSTNLGKGFVFDLVRDYNGSISKTLQFYMEKGKVKILEHLNEKISIIYDDLLERKAVVHDLMPRNMLVQWHSNINYNLILVDGFGNSDFIKICDHSHLFAYAKLNRHFSRLDRMLESLVNNYSNY